MNADNLDSVSPPPVNPILQAHADSLSRPEIIKVCDHVYVAVGYAGANMIMIEGCSGIIIVDTTESGDAALKILEEFRKITSLPIKAIIQTHFHPDHITGTPFLLETCGDDKDNVMVIAHSTQYAELTKTTMAWETMSIGATYQFGVLLKPVTERVCCGIGLSLAPNTKEKQTVKPTHTFDKEAEYNIAGVKIKIFHTPGETDDQITVWIPEWKVVMPADNIYRAFPNLYAIRGSPPRNSEKWYQSLDFVKRLGAHHMVPSHTEPISGAKTIRRIITHYRDAIQFINDQTVRHLNNGVHVDDIVEKVKLPPSLADHPYLQQFYGMVPWSVRSVVTGRVGWFDKKSTHLFPLTFKDKTQYTSDLLNKDFPSSMNATEKLLVMAEEILTRCEDGSFANGKEIEENATWSLELSLQVIELESSDTEFYKRAVENALTALNYLAEATFSPLARNFFITKTKELFKKNLVIIVTLRLLLKKLPFWPIEIIMKRIPYSFIAENVSDQEKMAVLFEFPDVNQKYRYKMRHCILEYQDTPELVARKYDVKTTMNSDVWKKLLLDEICLSSAIESGEVKIDGNAEDFERFMNLLVLYKPNVLKMIASLM